MIQKYRRLIRAAVMPLALLMALSMSTVAQAQGAAHPVLGSGANRCERSSYCLYPDADFNHGDQGLYILIGTLPSCPRGARDVFVRDLNDFGGTSSWVNNTDKDIDVRSIFRVSGQGMGTRLFTMGRHSRSHWVGWAVNDKAESLYIGRC